VRVTIELPTHLRALANVDRAVQVEVPVAVQQPLTQRTLLDALEKEYPVLGGTIRDRVSGLRRPLVRFFACGDDLSHESPDAALPAAVASNAAPFIILGAIAGG
jgi:hypothetical protein